MHSREISPDPFSLSLPAYRLPLHPQVLESGLQKANVPYSYGFAIILLTVLVKVATFPLSKKSVRARVGQQEGGFT